jgi:hypothetical protein
MRKTVEKVGISADAAKRAADTAVGQFELAEGPWIVIDDREEKGITIIEPFTYIDNGKKAKIGLQYLLSNIGHSPANVEVWGEVVRATGKAATFSEESQVFDRLCSDAMMDFKKNPRTHAIVPEAKVMYGVEYDRGASSPYGEHMKAILMDSFNGKEVYLANRGCTVDESTAGDGKIHRTPFITQIRGALKKLQIAFTSVRGYPD